MTSNSVEQTCWCMCVHFLWCFPHSQSPVSHISWSHQVRLTQWDVSAPMGAMISPVFSSENLCSPDPHFVTTKKREQNLRYSFGTGFYFFFRMKMKSSMVFLKSSHLSPFCRLELLFRSTFWDIPTMSGQYIIYGWLYNRIYPYHI